MSRHSARRTVGWMLADHHSGPILIIYIHVVVVYTTLPLLV